MMEQVDWRRLVLLRDTDSALHPVLRISWDRCGALAVAPDHLMRPRYAFWKLCQLGLYTKWKLEHLHDGGSSTDYRDRLRAEHDRFMYRVRAQRLQPVRRTSELLDGGLTLSILDRVQRAVG